MTKTCVLAFVCFLLKTDLYAQTVPMHFSEFVGQSYYWIIQQGDGSDTLSIGTIPPDGRVTLEVPKAYKNTRGMSRWMLKSGGGLDMILFGKPFSVECLSATPNEENISYTNNPENDFLKQNYKAQQKLLQQVNALSYTMQTLDSTDVLYASLAQRLETTKQDFAKLQTVRAKNKMYAARFGEIVDFTQGIADKLYDNEIDRAKYLDNWFVNVLDVEDLYTSGHWGQPIFGWVQMNANLLSTDSVFTSKILVKVNEPMRAPVFKDFIDALLYALVETGKDLDIALLAQNLKAQPNKWEHLSAKAKEHLISYNNTFGKKAPDLKLISLIETPDGSKLEQNILKTDGLGTPYTLLFFYKSNCGPCEDALLVLSNNYKKLQEKGVRLISISADEDENIFKSKLNYQPWPDVYCDLKGTEGINFKNYGVMGTPTLFILDDKGFIKSRLAKAQDVLGLFDIEW